MVEGWILDYNNKKKYPVVYLTRSDIQNRKSDDIPYYFSNV